MKRAMFSATKKSRTALQSAKRRAASRPGRPLKIGTEQSHAARREAAKARQLERRRAPEDQAMPAKCWPRVPKRATPTSGPVFPEQLPSSGFIDKRGNVRQWLQLRVSWVERRGAAYWVVVPHCFYPWCKTEEDQAEKWKAMDWLYRLIHPKDSALPWPRQAVMLEGWEMNGEAAIEAAIEAIAGLPPHVAALPINIPPTVSTRSAPARSALNALPHAQQRMPGPAGIEAEQRRRAEREEAKKEAALKRETPAPSTWIPPDGMWCGPAPASTANSHEALSRKEHESPARIFLGLSASEVLEAFRNQVREATSGETALLVGVEDCLESLEHPSP
jgi:hypothetical protein